jgi:hypothetical protein
MMVGKSKGMQFLRKFALGMEYLEIIIKFSLHFRSFLPQASRNKRCRIKTPAAV